MRTSRLYRTSVVGRLPSRSRYASRWNHASSLLRAWPKRPTTLFLTEPSGQASPAEWYYRETLRALQTLWLTPLSVRR